MLLLDRPVNMSSACLPKVCSAVREQILGTQGRCCFRTTADWRLKQIPLCKKTCCDVWNSYFLIYMEYMSTYTDPSIYPAPQLHKNVNILAAFHAATLTRLSLSIKIQRS